MMPMHRQKVDLKSGFHNPSLAVITAGILTDKSYVLTDL
jgi:hypothetical protein